MVDAELYEVSFDCPRSVVRMLGELAVIEGKDKSQIDGYIVSAIKEKFNRRDKPNKPKKDKPKKEDK